MNNFTQTANPYDALRLRMEGGLVPVRNMAIDAMLAENELDKFVTGAMNGMTPREKTAAVFITALLRHLAWHKAEEVARHCADNRLTRFAKATRVLREAKRVAFRYEEKLVGGGNFRKMDARAAQVAEEMQWRLYQLHLSINAELKRVYPDRPHHELDTLALTVVVICRMIYRYDRHAEHIIRQRMKLPLATITDPHMVTLEKIMLRVYGAPEDGIDFSKHILTCVRIIQKELEMIEFEITNE